MMLKHVFISSILVLTVGLSTLVSAEVSERSAYDILHDVKFRADGDTRKSEISMTLTSKDGFERVRHLTMVEADNGEDSKSLVYVGAPADVAGIGVLLHAYGEKSDREDDIWIYIPAMKKIKRLSSRNKRGRFVSSEMSFADLERLQLSDFTYELLGSEDINGVSAEKIESKVADNEALFKTGYSRKVTWVDRTRDLIVKEEYYDDQGHHLKTMMADKVEQVDGFWTVTQLHVLNAQTGDSTKLVLNSIEYNLPVNEAQFTKVALKRGL
jgi:hypothetical protein